MLHCYITEGILPFGEEVYMEISTFKRYEKKFILTEWQRDKLLAMIDCYMKPDRYCLNGNSYAINNTYYDTLNNEIIHNSLTSSFYKEKLRLRSYNLLSSPNDTVFLEIKKKICGVVSKRRAAMKLWEAERFIATGEKPQSKNYLDLQVINEIEFFLYRNNVQPKVFITYDRYALFGRDNADFRLTIDSNICAKRNAYDFNIPIIENDLYIMEIKIADSIPLWLSHIISELEIKRISFSKYGTEYRNHVVATASNNSNMEPDLLPDIHLRAIETVLNVG